MQILCFSLVPVRISNMWSSFFLSPIVYPPTSQINLISQETCLSCSLSFQRLKLALVVKDERWRSMRGFIEGCGRPFQFSHEAQLQLAWLSLEVFVYHAAKYYALIHCTRLYVTMYLFQQTPISYLSARLHKNHLTNLPALFQQVATKTKIR